MPLLYILFSLLLVYAKQEIEVQISYIDSPLADILWCGEQKDSDDKVLLLTTKGSVYQSINKGSTWEKLAEIFQIKGLVQIDDDQTNVGVPRKILRSPVNPQLVIFLGTEQVNWISPNCGSSISAIDTHRQLSEFQFHPKNQSLILASSWKKCLPQINQTEPCYVTKDLMLSTDMGLTWKLLAKYINQFSWGIKTLDHNNIPETRILISYQQNGHENQKLNGWNLETDFYYTDDFFQTVVKLVDRGNRFILSLNFLFVVQVQHQQEVTLLVADPNQPQYNFRQAELPSNLKEHSYTILDTSDGQVFVNINHESSDSPIGTIYSSDSTGTRYSVSLDNNVRTADGQCDFEKLQSLVGIYIANVYDKEQAQLYAQTYKTDTEVLQSTTDILKRSELVKYMQSQITYDKGATWQFIRYRNNKLHLNQISSRMMFGPFYSPKNSLGIIIGTGNVGEYLDHNPKNINTYFSRDGGQQWDQIFKGSHIYEIGDQGGIILVANDQELTNKIHYTLNEGQEWETFEFSPQPMRITNIITEPSNTRTKFIVYGRMNLESNEQQIEQGVLVTLDFRNLQNRFCEGSNSPNNENSDYQLWIPGLVPQCLLGQKVVYARKKIESRCFNVESWERKIYVDYCQCIEEDWECDLGFYRDNDGTGPCIPEQAKSFNSSKPVECTDYYYITTGYRKVAGNQCRGGVDHSAIQMSCSGPLQSIIYGIILLVILLAIYTLYQLIVKTYKDTSEEKTQNQFELKPIKVIQLDNNFIIKHSNKGGLGYREFDEDLLEKKEVSNEQIKVVEVEDMI